MPSTARSVQRFLPSRRERVAPPSASDNLDEFTPEVTMPAAPPGALRASVGWRKMAALGTAVVSIAVLSSLVAIRDNATRPRSVVAPAASPIEVEFPEYPGAPLLQTAVAAVPGRVTPGAQPEQVSANPDQGAAVAAIFSPHLAPPKAKPRSVRSEVVAALDTPTPFDVRSPLPQVSAVTSESVSPLNAAGPSTLADAPPRRIGRPLTLTTVGGGVIRNAHLALVLEVTEQGDVARVLAHEAVDVPPDMIESIATAALGWRYEPARRDGVAVPARVRVVVQLGGAQ